MSETRILAHMDATDELIRSMTRGTNDKIDSLSADISELRRRVMDLEEYKNQRIGAEQSETSTKTRIWQIAMVALGALGTGFAGSYLQDEVRTEIGLPPPNKTSRHYDPPEHREQPYPPPKEKK